jgi:dTDP-4-dehydrorhamnose reductase
MKRILLVGADGQVGRELQQTLAPLGELILATRQTLDLSQTAAIAAVIEHHQPDWIVNAAAYTAVDRAEQEPELATAINHTAPQILASQAQRQGAILFHISTDYVFDGSKGSPYQEEDSPQPIGVYGQTKWLGEQAVQQNCDRHIIFRTAWVHGAQGQANFVKTMLRLGAERPELRVVADQIGSPTWAGDIAEAIAQVLVQFQPDQTGIYHYTNSGAASWYDFAIAIFEEARLLGFPLKIEQVIPITTAEYPTPARRPAYSVLNCQKIFALLGSHPPHWRQSLRLMLADLYQRTMAKAE